MPATKLCYFRAHNHLSTTAKVLAITTQESSLTLHLDKTPFYPGGGGQPCDTGKASNAQCTISMQKIRRSPQDPQTIDHIGTLIEGQTPEIGDLLEVEVDPQTRELHNRLHSAGHVIDGALSILKVSFGRKPLKAYHYPDSPYVLFDEPYFGCKETLKNLIQEQCDRLIEQDLAVFIDFANDDAEDDCCERKMRIAGVISIPCGGTHVSSLGAIGKVIIRKIEVKKGTTKVCYQIA